MCVCQLPRPGVAAPGFTGGWKSLQGSEIGLHTRFCRWTTSLASARGRGHLDSYKTLPEPSSSMPLLEVASSRSWPAAGAPIGQEGDSQSRVNIFLPGMA